jgi:heme oxygenase
MRLWSIHAALDRALRESGVPRVRQDGRAQTRTDLLANDLAHFGVTRERLALLPQPVPPRLECRPAALGCRYVVEGSALGARAILPQVVSALGVGSERGATYFAGLGDLGKVLWRELLVSLNEISPHEQEADQAVGAARQTFRLFRQCLPAPTAETVSTAPLT